MPSHAAPRTWDADPRSARYAGGLSFQRRQIGDLAAGSVARKAHAVFLPATVWLDRGGGFYPQYGITQAGTRLIPNCPKKDSHRDGARSERCRILCPALRAANISIHS